MTDAKQTGSKAMEVRFFKLRQDSSTSRCVGLSGLRTLMATPADRRMADGNRAIRGSRFCGLPEEAEIDRQPRTGSMRGRKQKARHERKVIDEEAEFRLTSAPMRRTVKRKSEEKHVSRRKQCGFGEESSGQEANEIGRASCRERA